MDRTPDNRFDLALSENGVPSSEFMYRRAVWLQAGVRLHGTDALPVEGES